MQEGWARRPTLTAPARADASEARVGTKKRAFGSNKETAKGKRYAKPQTSLTRKAPYKVFGCLGRGVGAGAVVCGVRKPPGEETARRLGRGFWAMRLWGFEHDELGNGESCAP